MPRTFILKNLPPKRIFTDLARRYPDLEPSAVETLLVLLKTASDIISKIDDQMERRKTSQAKFSVMMHLNIQQGPLSPSGLAVRIGVSRATITGLLDGLERGGQVRREKQGGDRRTLLIRLTPKGQKQLDEMLPGHYRRISGLMARLSKADRSKLVLLLGRLGEGLPAMDRK